MCRLIFTLEAMNSPQLLLLTGMLFAAAQTNAATWIELGGSDAVVVSVDKDSLRRNGTKVKSWLKWQWSKPTDVPNTYPVKFYQLERQLQVTDCEAGTFAIAQGVRSDASANEVVDSYSVPEKSWRFEEAVPESIGEAIIKHVCKATARAGK